MIRIILRSTIHALLGLTAIGLSTFLSTCSSVSAADKDNCLMCHRHRSIGRIDENGRRWNYHVDELSHSHSVHNKIECRDCHTYITKIPHDPVIQEINCATQCHIRPPFSQETFSHEKIVGIFNQSSHGIRPQDSEELKNAKPTCKFCHLNPLYIAMPEENVPFQETLNRCANCHPQNNVVLAYKHITHRLRHKASRSPQEIVQLCDKCHDDKALLKKLNVSAKALAATESYNRSIHGKLVRLGSKKAADCISCHSSDALHDIYGKDNPKATIHPDNLARTCRQCHEKTNDWFAKIAVHPSVGHKENIVIYGINFVLRIALYGSVLSLVGLMLFETMGRRRSGVRFLLKQGSSWQRRPKTKPNKEEQ